MSALVPADVLVPIPGQPGQVVAVKVWGNTADYKHAFVGCHGWLDNANTFDLIARDLCLDPKIAFFSIDFSGHGLSSHAQGSHKYTGTTGYLGDVLTVVEYFAIERFIAIGHSMGGGVLSGFSAVFPERVTHFICIENLGQPSVEAHRIPERVRQYFDGKDRNVKLKRTKPKYASLEDAATARANAELAVPLSAARILSSRGLETLYNSASRRIEYTWRTDQALTLPWPWSATNEVALAFLSRIKASVLLVFGSDGYFDLSAKPFQDRLAAIKSKKIVTVKGGHHPHLEDAAPEIVTHIRQFIGLQNPLASKL